MSVNLTHKLDLFTFLWRIRLLNAYCIGPEGAFYIFEAEMLECVKEIQGYVKLVAIDNDASYFATGTPDVAYA